MQPYTHFTLSERKSLSHLLQQGKSFRQIARELGRSPSTISRELKRNGNKDGSYHHWWGTSLYIYRRRCCRRHYRFDDDPQLVAFIAKKLHRFWSPEIIVVKWKQAHPDAKLSASTIYSALRYKRLPGCSERLLRRRGRLRFKSSGNTGMNPVKPEHNISEWPEEIINRARLGDFEGDTIRGGRGKGYIFSSIDRRSRLVALSLIPGKRTKEDTAAAVCRALAGHEVRSLTLDNGTEFAGHKDIAADLNTTVYFADPGCPWQRGSNENLNGMLRYFFPKGCDLRQVTEEELRWVETILNERPRKCLDWLSPKEFLAKCCT